MEMEKREKKSTRREVEGDELEEEERSKKLKGKDGDPTEEEVEELYAILRRMKEAVNYFHRKGRGGKEWKQVLEHAQEVTLVDDDHHHHHHGEPEKENKGKEVIMNEAFDLNTLAPEADDDA